MAPRSEEQLEELRRERSQDIIRAALKLFAENGVTNTSVSQIAKEADISKGLIYNYFDGKHQLLQKVIQEGMKKMPMDVTAPTNEKEAKRQLEYILDKMFKSAKADRIFWKFYAELLLQLIRDETLAAEFEEEFEQYITLFVNLLARMGDPQPEIRGRMLTAQLDGILLHGLYFKDYPLESIFEHLKQQYLSHENPDTK